MRGRRVSRYLRESGPSGGGRRVRRHPVAALPGLLGQVVEAKRWWGVGRGRGRERGGLVSWGRLTGAMRRRPDPRRPASPARRAWSAQPGHGLGLRSGADMDSRAVSVVVSISVEQGQSGASWWGRWAAGELSWRRAARAQARSAGPWPGCAIGTDRRRRGRPRTRRPRVKGQRRTGCADGGQGIVGLESSLGRGETAPGPTGRARRGRRRAGARPASAPVRRPRGSQGRATD